MVVSLPDFPLQTGLSTVIQPSIPRRNFVSKDGTRGRGERAAAVLGRSSGSGVGLYGEYLKNRSGIPSTLMCRARSLADDPESAGSWPGEFSESSQCLDLSCLDSPASDAPVEARAI